MKKVSFIVPIYNSSKYLVNCLDSLVNQTLNNIEIILINDGSSDDSINIIKRYSKKYSNIIYFDRKNEGIGSSRNFGIEKSSGKYIAFVDSDDYISVNFAKSMYNFCEENNLDMAVCDYYKVEDGKKTIEEIFDFGITNIKKDRKLILNINYSPWNKLYKREMIIKNNIHFSTNLKYEDMPFIFKAIICSKKIGKHSIPLNYYMIHNNSETTVMDKRVYDIFEILKTINSYYKDDKYLEYLNVRTIFIYTIQQRYQKSKRMRNDFIDKAFAFLNSTFPNWKSSDYFKERNKIKATIEKSKFLTKIYCNLYSLFK